METRETGASRSSQVQAGCFSAYLLPPLIVVAIGLSLGAATVRSGFVIPRTPGDAGSRGSPSAIEAGSRAVATLFRPEVRHWSLEIEKWAASAGLDPNLAAVVMQIESCGDPQATSRSGAAGLFQVMPFHFLAHEDAYDPDTNATRGLAYLARSLAVSNGDARRALAGYNGGIGLVGKPEDMWPEQTMRYVRYAVPIYEDALRGESASAALDEWYGRFGAGLCRQAAANLGT